MLQVTAILSWIVRSWTDVENNIVSVERVNEYADTTKEVSLSHGIVTILYYTLLYYTIYRSYIQSVHTFLSYFAAVTSSAEINTKQHCYSSSSGSLSVRVTISDNDPKGLLCQY